MSCVQSVVPSQPDLIGPLDGAVIRLPEEQPVNGASGPAPDWVTFHAHAVRPTGKRLAPGPAQQDVDAAVDEKEDGEHGQAPQGGARTTTV